MLEEQIVQQTQTQGGVVEAALVLRNLAAMDQASILTTVCSIAPKIDLPSASFI
jgi:hypothetical protein